MNDKINRLKSLLSQASKHSAYQLLSGRLTDLIGAENVEVKSRYENERLEFVLSHVEVSGKKILDIGGNTGFFSFECLDHGADSVVMYEGNTSHAEFVEEAARLLGVENKLEVQSRYFLFKPELITENYDVIFLLNVLHHIGDDYGDKSLGIQNARESILESLNMLGGKTKYLVFQLGFCWQGDRNKLLFENGTKEEMIDFISSGINKNWDISVIGIAEKLNGKVVYNKASENNLQRQDAMGEFLNRPLFILRSKLK